MSPFNNIHNTIPPRTIDASGYGKTAIVTGCASGVGLATAQAFLSHQFEVLGVDINEMDFAKIDERDEERFHFHRGDLMKEGECDEVVRLCIAQFGEKIDVLANAAEIMDSFEAADVISDQVWDRIIGVNLTAPTKLIRAVLPFMKAKKNGAIINVASKAGMSGIAAGVAYTASKHGLIGVTKSTAWRFKDEGIRCNAVLPGFVDTNIHQPSAQENFDQATYKILAPVIALHSGMPPVAHISAAEVANLIVFLASDQAKSINGALVPIDTAWSII